MKLKSQNGIFLSVSERVSAKARLLELVDETLDAGFLSAAVAIRSSNDPVISACRGEAFDQSNNEDSLSLSYMAGSQVKLVISCALAALVRCRGISLEDVASRYIGVRGMDLRDVTIGALLTHTSGLGNFMPALLIDQWRGQGRRFTAQELLEVAVSNRRQTAAAGDFNYNNANYIVLSLVIEEIMQQPLSESLHDLVFGPLGMRSAQCGAIDILRRENIAKGYLGDQKSPRQLDMSSVRDLSIAMGSGELIWSINDALKFAFALLDEKACIVPGLQSMVKVPQTVGSGDDWIWPDRYGYGIEGFENGDARIWGHRGLIWGTASATFVDAERRLILTGFATHCDSASGRISGSKRSVLRNLFLSPFSWTRGSWG